MRIVCISDTHLMLDRIAVPDGDVLIHAGDGMNRGDEMGRYAEQLSALPHAHKVIIAGNHDWAFQKEPALAKALLAIDKRVIYLQDEETTIDGILFYGSPWQPEFCNWAFNLPRNGEALRHKWSQIPAGVDVLITHGPPFGYCDTVSPRPLSLGCELLRKAVDEKRPRFHVFGHIHDGYGTKSVGETTFVNASVCTEQYRPINAPIVFELEARK